MSKFYVADDADKLAEDLSIFIESNAKSSIADHGYFAIGLSGGSSAKFVGNGLAKLEDMDWKKWHVFFCDERFVPLSDPDSNFSALKGSLFDKVAIPMDQIYTIDPGLSIEAAAEDYSSKLKSLFGDVKLPSFDLLVLGMGPDGHICSLFPNHPALDEEEKWTTFLIDSPKPPPQRITLTLPVVNNSRKIVFTVTGESKAKMVRKASQGVKDKSIPASLVSSTDDLPWWYVDKDAALQTWS